MQTACLHVSQAGGVGVGVGGGSSWRNLLDGQTGAAGGGGDLCLYLTLSSSEATVFLKAPIWASLCLTDSTR